jgi:hypothetical protein
MRSPSDRGMPIICTPIEPPATRAWYSMHRAFPKTGFSHASGPLTDTLQAPISWPEPTAVDRQNQSSISRQRSSEKKAPPFAPQPGANAMTRPMPSGSHRGTWSSMTLASASGEIELALGGANTHSPNEPIDRGAGDRMRLGTGSGARARCGQSRHSKHRDRDSPSTRLHSGSLSAAEPRVWPLSERRSHAGDQAYEGKTRGEAPRVTLADAWVAHGAIASGRPQSAAACLPFR